jgi:hypothetical protein
LRYCGIRGQFPGVKTVADLGKSDTKVLYTEGQTYMEYLVGAGILGMEQIDGSYTGAPDLFVGAYRGKAAIQGLATSEPYLYEHEIKRWAKPLRFQLVNDTGFPAYFDALAIRSADKANLAPCLAKLVPIIQRAQVEFMNDPQNALNIIVETAKRYETSWQYSRALAMYSAKAMGELGIVGNGVDQTLGNFDVGRLRRIIDVVNPILEKHGKPVRRDLRADDIATNDFVDPEISLPH